MAQITHPLGFQDLEDRLTVTVEEAASLLSLGRTAAYEAARRGEIPTRRLGRRLIVPVEGEPQCQSVGRGVARWLACEDPTSRSYGQASRD